ncbi:hypothetical protein AMATHDRAFT_9290 [Amanita thiersii Skay4041]|uniref:Uncharacterized protein n=1 Tax=Amanita thiersii Skay4041 TaxID=703135 RepID=A0A2A9NAZ4_9AGAR|nr:hypothetical protein AMATHDRAFT_9290 [Amanita thiersii Skay4041]
MTDLLAQIITYAAVELNTKIADYTVASHGSTIPLMIYHGVQEDWDYSGNSENFLLTDTAKTLQDDLDEAFSNKQHKNIMAITTPITHFTEQDKHSIVEAIANDTPLPKKWAFTDEKGHKHSTSAWLSGQPSPKKHIAPTTSFSPSIGQKRPLEMDQTTDMEDLTYREKLQAIKFRLPLPQSTLDANLDMWTETTNKYMGDARLANNKINPTTLFRKLARSKDQTALMEFTEECYRALQNEINLLTHAQPQDTPMQDVESDMSKTERIRRTTAIWKNTVKTLWKDNILTCKQETLDQATRLLLLADTSHKYASLSESDIYNTELDQRDLIIVKITELNENADKIIKDIQHKSIHHSLNKEKLELIKKQGWEMAKCNVTQNPGKFAPSTLPPANFLKIVLDIVKDLKEKEDNSWETKILKDIKNKGIQSKALEARTQIIVRRLNNLRNIPTPSPWPPSRTPSVIETGSTDPTDQEMSQADPLPWTDMEDYKQNRQLWINSASEIFEKLSPYLQPLERKQKEELLWEAADICALQDKDLLQLQSISSFTDSNKKRELEDMHKFSIDKEYQSLLTATAKQEASHKKDTFEDYLAMKDFDYYVQHAKDQISNPSIPEKKKNTLKSIIKDAEKWQPKHRVDDDGSILLDSPPPSPVPKPKTKPLKKSEDTRKAADLTRKGNTPNTR